MRSDDLNREPAEAIKAKLTPTLRYLNRLQTRMLRRGFRPSIHYCAMSAARMMRFTRCECTATQCGAWRRATKARSVMRVTHFVPPIHPMARHHLDARSTSRAIARAGHKWDRLIQPSSHYPDGLRCVYSPIFSLQYCSYHTLQSAARPLAKTRTLRACPNEEFADWLLGRGARKKPQVRWVCAGRYEGDCSDGSPRQHKYSTFYPFANSIAVFPMMPISHKFISPLRHCIACSKEIDPNGGHFLVAVDMGYTG
jgi:hypothetical protein